MKIQIIIGAVAALSLSACVQNQYAGSNSNAQTGAVIGGIWGFVDGVILGFIFAWLYNKFAGE